MYGENVHRAVIASGARRTGATVHLVDEGYDTGAIVARQEVEVLPDDTPETLAARVIALEHKLYPRVVIEMATTLGRSLDDDDSKQTEIL